MSKAKLDLPDPESPVITVIFSLGIVTFIFFKLCSLAPNTLIESEFVLMVYPMEKNFKL